VLKNLSDFTPMPHKDLDSLESTINLRILFMRCVATGYLRYIRLTTGHGDLWVMFMYALGCQSCLAYLGGRRKKFLYILWFYKQKWDEVVRKTDGLPLISRALHKMKYVHSTSSPIMRFFSEFLAFEAFLFKMITLIEHLVNLVQSSAVQLAVT